MIAVVLYKNVMLKFNIPLSGICRSCVAYVSKRKLPWGFHIYRNFCVKSKSAQNSDLEWQSVVGLEIHAQISAKSKLFSCSGTNFDAPTNTEVSYFDAAFPGCLPVLNKCCFEAGLLTALALNCTINKISMFDRKHYFYPDLPAGYQITQHFYPLASGGNVEFYVSDQTKDTSYQCCAYLKQLQLEQDSGRSFHMQGEKSLVDLNRAGIGLMELVFEPNLKNGLEASALVKELILILKRLGTCSCEMEAGALRVDANVSVNLAGEPLGVKTEIKNINSLRYIARAIDFEISRQKKLLQDCGYVKNETRAFDYDTKETVFMRDKETLQDYRFIPEPNLPPIRICESESGFDEDDDFSININMLHKQLPVLPITERKELIKKYDLTYEIADKLVSIEGLKGIFEGIASRVDDRSFICSFLLNNVQHQLNMRKLSFSSSPLSVMQMATIIQLVVSKTISEATANDILQMMFNGDQRSAQDIVNEHNWYQISDAIELEKLCKKAMAARPKMVRKYKNSQKQRYMTSLLIALNESVNNRASIKDAERIFIKLICSKDKPKASESLSDQLNNGDVKSCDKDS